MTTTPVPTCTDDLLAEIESHCANWIPGDGDLISGQELRALLARLRAAEKEIGMHRRFQHSQMNDITVPVLKLAQELGITGGSAAEDVQAMIRHVRAAEVDAGRYRWLRDMDCNSFSLSRNDSNAPNYMTAEEFIDTYPDEFSEVDPCELQRMKKENAIWCITIYPDTPIGSDNWQAASLDAAIDAAMEVSK